MKLIAKSKNGRMLKVGEDEKTAKWYFMSEAVRNFVEKNRFNVGDTVEISSSNKNGSYYINKITKDGVMTTSSDSSEKPKTTFKYGKSDEEIESIKRQAVMKAVADAIKTLTGTLPKEELPEYMTTLYDLLYQKISE